MKIVTRRFSAALRLVVPIVAVLFAGPLRAEEAAKPAAGESETELAKKTQNPVADLISVPFQSNFNFGVGPRDALLYILNVQPVIPIRLTEDWNLITRTIMPIISQGSPAPGIDHVGGLGDINPSLFLSPSKPGKLIWGVGPTFTLPTASNRLLGSGKWSAGPTGVVLVMQGPWVYGALVEQPVVVRRLGRQGREADAGPAVPELELRQGLVPHQRSDHDGQLDDHRRQRVDRPRRRRWG